jgi:hypothetical protein
MTSNRNQIEMIAGQADRLRQLLEEHRGSNHVAGVVAISDSLANDEIPLDDRINRARSIFKTMMGGMGTLGDFMIWNESEAERSRLNGELSEILAKLWNALEC